MDNLILKGAMLGLTISILIGPLLFAILQAGIEKGFLAGFSVAAGIWMSDVIFVTIIYHSLAAIENITAISGFKTWAGLAGAVVLMIFGVGNIWPQLGYKLTNHDKKIKEHKVLFSHLHTNSSFLLKGFILNTINPFTVFFWAGIAGGIVLPNQWHGSQLIVFLSSILAVLAVTDTLKAYLAQKLRQFLTPIHIIWVRKGVGILLLCFGIVMIVRIFG